jgi:thioesterase domain-containing protein
MRSIQSAGPYAIVGHCAGSWVAFEMAAQLQALDADVEPLVLIDSEPPGIEAPPRRWLRHALQRTWHYARDRRLRNALRWKLAVARERLRASRAKGGERDRVAIVRLVHAAAHRRYGGTLVKGDAWFLRSEESVVLTDKDWHLRWADVITGELRTRVVPGAHSTLLERPNVDVLAARLQEALDRTERSR